MRAITSRAGREWDAQIGSTMPISSSAAARSRAGAGPCLLVQSRAGVDADRRRARRAHKMVKPVCGVHFGAASGFRRRTLRRWPIFTSGGPTTLQSAHDHHHVIPDMPRTVPLRSGAENQRNGRSRPPTARSGRGIAGDENLFFWVGPDRPPLHQRSRKYSKTSGWPAVSFRARPRIAEFAALDRRVVGDDHGPAAGRR